MKKTLIAAALFCAMTTPAFADYTYGNSGRVFETFQQCESARARSSTIGTGVGAVVGGVAGNRIGSNNNRDEATVIGGAIGAIAGNKVSGATSCRQLHREPVRASGGGGGVRCDYGTRTLEAPDGRVISSERVRMCRQPGRRGWYLR